MAPTIGTEPHPVYGGRLSRWFVAAALIAPAGVAVKGVLVIAASLCGAR